MIVIGGLLNCPPLLDAFAAPITRFSLTDLSISVMFSRPAARISRALFQ
ncbi:hypothetical protein USDA257_c01670 [Sinorhizobium fredii USDA 257]|uniref:Uncharacterized protein n=1 Tax=Sinorhizobium fredii (strain USDA 257) TaxID=1185652 RepID=I3WYR1_SINF2|nr:hypothetical protein USDA257_c01670 [Sinorhizobium fredii USDA 257]